MSVRVRPPAPILSINYRLSITRDGAIILITHEGREEVGRRASATLTIPVTLDLLTPILASVPLQLLAYHIALRRGCDVDQPRNLAKSVTVE